MDGKKFDDLLRRFSAIRLTRGDTLRGLVTGTAAALTGAILAADSDAKGKKNKGKGKKSKKHKKSGGQASTTDATLYGCSADKIALCHNSTNQNGGTIICPDASSGDLKGHCLHLGPGNPTDCYCPNGGFPPPNADPSCSNLKECAVCVDSKTACYLNPPTCDVANCPPPDPANECKQAICDSSGQCAIGDKADDTPCTGGVCCSGVCTNNTTTSNCGTCGTTCNTANCETCQSGTCGGGCTGGQTCCPGTTPTCTTLGTNTNCHACGDVCNTANCQTCQSGTCSGSCCSSCTIGFYTQNGCFPTRSNLTCPGDSTFCTNTALCSAYRTGCTLNIASAIKARGDGNNGTYCAQLAAAYLNQQLCGSGNCITSHNVNICNASISDLTQANEGFGFERCPLNARCRLTCPA